MSDDYKFGIEEEYFLVDAETKSVAREMPAALPEQRRSASSSGLKAALPTRSVTR